LGNSLADQGRNDHRTFESNGQQQPLQTGNRSYKGSIVGRKGYRGGPAAQDLS
jgi:hypothetical protein